MADYTPHKINSLMALLGKGLDNGSAGAIQSMRGQQAAAEQASQQAFEQPFKQGALDVAKQQANTQEAYRKNWAELQEQEMRARLLERLLTGNQKPLSVEQERAETLSKEGLEATNRVVPKIQENPNAARAVMAAEKARGIPVIGGLAGDAISGLANFFNPKAGEIEADREKIARNMLYLKSGANAPEKEVQGMVRQLPSMTTPTGDTERRFQEFTSPFSTTRSMHQRAGTPQIDPEAAMRFVKSGGPLPTAQPQAPSPASAPQTKTVGGKTYVRTPQGWVEQ